MQRGKSVLEMEESFKKKETYLELKKEMKE